MEEYDMLNDRQRKQAEQYAELAVEYGMFDQTTGANGAHYAPAKLNPFVKEGMACKNCVFFDEAGNQCQIVSGPIEPEAVCKLWVIPENLLVGVQPPKAMEAAINIKEFYIRKDAPGCKGSWATVDGKGDIVTCHETKDQAVKHMVAASIGAGEQPGGEWSPKK
jgi:hypothetical protein